MTELSPPAKVYLLTMIDGHKGTMCGDFVRDNLHPHIRKQPGMEVLGGDLSSR